CRPLPTGMLEGADGLGAKSRCHAAEATARAAAMTNPSWSSICLRRGRDSCLSVEWRPGKLEERAMPLLLASPAIPPGGEIPSQYTCDGADISPRLTWSGVPNGTKSLVLVVEDRMRPPGYPAIGLFSTFPAVHTVSTPVIPQTGQPRVRMRCAMILASRVLAAGARIGGTQLPLPPP